LANTKDINSTERLLNVIRGSQQPSSTAIDAAEDLSPKQKQSDKFSVNFPRVFTGKHRVKVGVDIGRDDISFAKMTKTSDGRPLLVDQKILKFGDQIHRGSNEFNDLLKSSLTAFAGSLDDCDIWTLMSAAEVNVQHLKIPIVPKKQLENVIYWTAKKENPIDEKDVIFDYEMQGEITDQGIPKYSVMVYSAPRSEVERVRGMFSSIGVNLTGITIAPFAIQNIFRTKWIAVAEPTFASLYIGNDFSRIDIFSKNNLVMTRGIKTGISSMMEAIEETIAETSTNKMADKERIKKILNDLSADPGKSLEDEDGVLWNETSISNMITPALERLTRQIERTLEYYVTSVGYEKVEKIYISSVLNVFNHPLLNYISEQLGAKSEFFDPYQGKNASVSGASLSIAERASLVPVLGLALSDRKHTPNAIFTYVEKNKEITRKRINRGIFATFAAALALCLVILFFQAIETSQLSARQGKLEKELSLFHPILSKDKITALAENLKLRHQNNHDYSDKYKGMAIISELSFLTPENIRLINVRIAIPAGGMQEQKKDAVQKEKNEGVIIEGVVLGERNTLDALLAQYVVKLENSPILQGVTLQKSNFINFKKKEIFQFTINAKIG
jgi:Tfp pilus assembly PilM family ATPase